MPEVTDLYLIQEGCVYEGGGVAMVYTDLAMAIEHVEALAAYGMYGDADEFPWVPDEEDQTWCIRAYSCNSNYLRLVSWVPNRKPATLQFREEHAAPP